MLKDLMLALLVALAFIAGLYIGFKSNVVKFPEWYNGNGYYFIEDECWAYAPYTYSTLQEAIKDCELTNK